MLKVSRILVAAQKQAIPMQAPLHSDKLQQQATPSGYTQTVETSRLGPNGSFSYDKASGDMTVKVRNLNSIVGTIDGKLQNSIPENVKSSYGASFHNNYTDRLNKLFQKYHLIKQGRDVGGTVLTLTIGLHDYRELRQGVLEDMTREARGKG